jgi:hypothetical protein
MDPDILKIEIWETSALPLDYNDPIPLNLVSL